MLTPTFTALSRMYKAGIDLYLDDKWTDSRRKTVEELFPLFSYANKLIKFNESEFDRTKYSAIYWTSHGERYACWQYFQHIADLKSMFPDDDDSWLQSKIHEVDFYLEPLYDNGYGGIAAPQLNDLQSFRFRPVSGPLIVGLCNGFFAEASVNWGRKAWPYFDELVILISEFFNKNVEIVLLGKGKLEVKWAQDIETLMELRGYMVKNLVDTLDIKATIRNIGKLDVLISTDTGLMHVADALGVPLVAIFGSTLASKNGPYRKGKSKIVSSLEGCAPCQNTYKFHLCDNFACMRNISPADVFGQLLTLLGEQNYVFS